jgi:hypothetical protein
MRIGNNSIRHFGKESAEKTKDKASEPPSLLQTYLPNKCKHSFFKYWEVKYVAPTKKICKSD